MVKLMVCLLDPRYLDNIVVFNYEYYEKAYNLESTTLHKFREQVYI